MSANGTSRRMSRQSRDGLPSYSARSHACRRTVSGWCTVWRHARPAWRAAPGRQPALARSAPTASSLPTVPGLAAQTQGQTLLKAIERKASAQEMCRLFGDYLAARTKYIREIEAQGSVCGTSPEALKNITQSHAMDARHTKQVCEAAARPRDERWPLGDHGYPAI